MEGEYEGSWTDGHHWALLFSVCHPKAINGTRCEPALARAQPRLGSRACVVYEPRRATPWRPCYDHDGPGDAACRPWDGERQSEGRDSCPAGCFRKWS